MKDILLTSSVLIAIIFLIRRIFRNVISRRVQYALWSLALIRLLIPFQLPGIEHNVLTATAPVNQAITQHMESNSLYIPINHSPLNVYPDTQNIAPTSQTALPTEENTPESQSMESAVSYRKLTETDILWILWAIGAAAAALSFILCNLSFFKKIRKARTPYRIDSIKYPVYLVTEELPSPCLFGLFRPAIYLTPAALKDEQTLRHVLAHEMTHARHLDPLWALLRGVCLVIYWFDPLVWAAAFASRTDCELACDEGALKLLGEDERLSYGKTLLSLIPIRRDPTSPLLSATTMTSEKKHLRERVKRIAENHQTVHAALFVLSALLIMACAMTFTAANTPPTVSLSEEEIDWFNTEFFNGDGMNIRNQFLSSDYAEIEKINVYELLYAGGGIAEPIPTGSEKQEVLDTYYDGIDPDCEGIKLPEGKIDALLLQHTGLLLSDLQAIGMGGYHYLAKYNAYYHYHGDTNYRPQITIISGEREGDIVRLFYYDDFVDMVWKCVTLQYREEVGTYETTFDPSTGRKSVRLVETSPGYLFVSNLPSEPPAVSFGENHIILPDDEAEVSIKLNNITPIGPIYISLPEANGAAVRKALGTAETKQITLGAYTVLCWLDESTGLTHFSYGRTDGNIGETTFYDILISPSHSYSSSAFGLESFTNILGHNGFMISYLGDTADSPRVSSGIMIPYPTGGDDRLLPIANGNYIIHRYYAIQDGHLQLLATTVGGWDQTSDLNGDGTQELFFDGDYLHGIDHLHPFLFSHGGKIYGLDINTLAKEAYPHWEYVRTGVGDGRSIPVIGSYLREDGAYVDAFRTLYFTGDTLEFYPDTRETSAHVMGTPDVPAEILTFAKEEVSRYYKMSVSEEWNQIAKYDDWRIEHIAHSKTYSFIGGEIEVYNLNFEFHASNPAGVMLAGGMYHREDDWVMPSYPNCFWLYVANQNGTRKLLDMRMINDCSPGIELFDNDIYNMAMDEGLTTLADLDGRALLQRLATNTTALLEEMTGMTLDEQKRTAEKICYYRTSGAESEQQLYQNTMQALVQWNTYELTTAQYDAWSLLFNYHVCQPAELSEQDRSAALEAAERYMTEIGTSDACLSFSLISVSVDSLETWNIVNRYTDSALAVAQGYDHETMTYLTAVQAVYNVEWNPHKSAADESGRSARYLYLLPDEDGRWFVWDQRLCATPALYEMAVNSLSADTFVTLQLNGSGYITEQGDYWRYRVQQYPLELTWNRLEDVSAPAGDHLTLGNTEMGVFIRCWKESDLVQVRFLDEEEWYTTSPLYKDAAFDGHLFTRIRQWFDDTQHQALQNEIMIKNRGQSHTEVAQEWAERYAAISTRVHQLSQYACSYSEATSVSLQDWVPESAYPEHTKNKERFCFGFSCVFVPETETALNYLMAGNTEKHDGAPEGSYIYHRVGFMHLEDDGWHCDGIGTGI